ncbi:MAG: chromosome partitioning protein ParA [Planctomycetaceae bacterium]|nr:chromosome partitioning protein ParA [Planctomycetaceae bacterium]
MHSCIYAGKVHHRRFTPVENSFAYRGFWMYLDLAELDEVFNGHWLWSTRRPAVAWFRERDHLEFPETNGSSDSTSRVDLETSIRNLVESETRQRPDGAIRLLTNLRYFGYVMNPVSFYYCYDKSERLKTIVAEVNNTPWNERHCYVLDSSASVNPDSSTRHRFMIDKEFHVSPFMDLDYQYKWQLVEPGKTLTVHIENWKQQQNVFDVTFHLKRKPITSANLAASIMRHPFMTGKTFSAIYWQALKLWWKRCPFYSHPDSRAEETTTANS